MNRLSARQIQKLSQKLSPQQIQMIKLLELPTIQLEQRIKQEIEENPVLDIDEDIMDSSDKEEQSEPVNVNIEEYVKREETPAYRLNINNHSVDDKHGVIPISDGLSLTEYLYEQLSFQGLSERELTIGRFLIGSLDGDGYLRRDLENISDDIAFSLGMEASVEEIGDLLRMVQSFEPAGIGARDLQESLLLQLKTHPQTSDVRLATKILSSHFDDFAKRHFEKITYRLAIGDESFRDAVSVITSLSPKPANLYSETQQSEPTIQIVPDFVLDNTTGELELSLNKNNIPNIKINSSYIRMLENISVINKMGSGGQSSQSDRSASQFIRQKIDSARWFMTAIKQRNATMLITMNAIIDFQREYFEQGDETLLRPMILKDIAEITGLDVSTISRVVNSKYIQTPFGIYLLKYFFSEAMQTDEGKEVSSREIKSILRGCVDGEDKRRPLTDEALMIILNDKGYQIARRTVAKYREMLDIPVARLRKEF